MREQFSQPLRCWRTMAVLAVCLMALNPPVSAAEPILTPDQSEELDHAVDRGLEFLERQQSADGSFPSLDYAQPAVTSFCVMAFLSRGHTPGEGPYGEQIVRSVDFVLATQQPGGRLFDFPQGRREWSKGTYNYSVLLKALVENQRPNGSWEPDSMSDAPLGSVYSTALAVLALTPPYQLLPVYQR